MRRPSAKHSRSPPPRSEHSTPRKPEKSRTARSGSAPPKAANRSKSFVSYSILLILLHRNYAFGYHTTTPQGSVHAHRVLVLFLALRFSARRKITKAPIRIASIANEPIIESFIFVPQVHNTTRDATKSMLRILCKFAYVVSITVYLS